MTQAPKSLRASRRIVLALVFALLLLLPAVVVPPAGALREPWNPIYRTQHCTDAVSCGQELARYTLYSNFEFDMNGNGSILVRVIPNVGVVVPLGLSGPASVACARNCPAGFSAALRNGSLDATSGGPTVYRDDKGTLVPPPADTSGVKQSPDAPQAKNVGALPWVAALAAAALAARLRRR